MAGTKKESVKCQICGLEKRPDEVVPAELVKPDISGLIQKDHPGWRKDGYICRTDLNSYRGKYVQYILETEKGDLSVLEQDVLDSLKKQELVSENLNVEFEQQLTFGERLADAIASFGGSWRFISIFAGVLVIWITINSIVLLIRPFDPFPFILLNLILSCLAAIQAPIIMMSQNRQESKDRLREEHDYRVNLKAELEIRQIHEKLDHLLINQWEHLVEIQGIQMDLMEELARKSR